MLRTVAVPLAVAVVSEAGWHRDCRTPDPAGSQPGDRKELYRAFLSGGNGGVHSGPPVAATSSPRPNEDREAQLVSFVLDDAQKTWTKIFADQGKAYRHAKLVLYRDATYSACGTAQAATGPFYCPSDEKVYIDLGFWDDLKRMGGDSGDFAQAYVIAHELGHHIQKLTGIEARMRRLSQQAPGQGNRLSVDLRIAGRLLCRRLGAYDGANAISFSRTTLREP